MIRAFIRRSNQELKEHCTTNGLHIDPLTINLERPNVTFQLPGSVAKGTLEAEDPMKVVDVDPDTSVGEEVISVTKPKNVGGGYSCSVLGCSNHSKRDRDRVKFFQIPTFLEFFCSN